MICEHCQTDSKQMTALSNGDQSKCCVGCWQKFEADRDKHRKRFTKKWLQDRRDEDAAGCFDPRSDPERVKTTARNLKAQRAT